MRTSSGKKRVIINNVLPRVENGIYPAKAIVNEQITISANIFTDGHDEISARIFIKHVGEALWKEHPLILQGNDCWETKFTPSKLGRYQFYTQGWVNHFITWQKGLKKKYDARQQLDVDFLIGIQIAEEALAYADEQQKDAISQWIEKLKVAKEEDESMAIAMSSEIEALIAVCVPVEAITTSLTFEIEVDRKKAMFSTWYELFPRSSSPEPGQHGTFNNVKDLLPYIAKMGFDVLYFPPIHPIGEKKRKGKNNSLNAMDGDPGSPWAIGNRDGGHKAIHAQLGTLNDFRDLIDESKKYNVEIAMDIAFQCAPDHPYVTEHPAWFKWRPDGTVQYAENPPKKYEDILPFNFETEDWEALWQELKSVIEYWIDKGVYIFRIDNPHTKALAFWEWAIREIKDMHPEVIFLAEAFTRPRIMEQLAKAGFTQSYTYFTWRNTKKELEQYMAELTKTELKYYFRPNFWPNTPDILPPELTEGKENAHIIRLLLAATLSSNYGLYGPVFEYGLHTPMPGKEEYIDNEKYEIKHWDWKKYTKIKEIITKVNRIRRENTALQSTGNIEFAETTNEKIICYIKADYEGKNILIIAVNLDPHSIQSANIKIPAAKLESPLSTSYTVRDLLSGDTYTWTNEWNYVRLDPNELPAHILKVKADNLI